MAIISSFLCWSNTRTGSAVCGYYTLVISVVCLAFYMLRYIALDEMKDSIELKGIVYAGFVLYSFLIGVSLILLPGVYMDRKFLLLPWIYVLVITVLYETGAIALITTVHLEQDHTLNVWEIVAVVFYCLRLVANCYCFACVVSQYQELSEGRGTYEFLFKPRRRMARGAPMSDMDEYHPPYGAALPPYSEDNPYKEFSPPNYENLALEEEDRRWDSVYSSYRLRGAASASCLVEVIVNTPPPGFDDIEICGEDDNDSNHRQSHRRHHHHHHESDQHDQTTPHNHRHHHQSHQHHPRRQNHHHRHHSLPHSHLNESNSRGDNQQHTRDVIINHTRHRSAGSKPNSNSDCLDERLQQSSCRFQELCNHRSNPDSDITCPHRHDMTPDKEPITMTESSGSFLSFSQTDFRTPTPKSSPASVHSCQGFNRSSSPAIQKRTYITWI